MINLIIKLSIKNWNRGNIIVFDSGSIIIQKIEFKALIFQPVNTELWFNLITNISFCLTFFHTQSAIDFRFRVIRKKKFLILYHWLKKFEITFFKKLIDKFIKMEIFSLLEKMETLKKNRKRILQKRFLKI